MLNHTEDLLQDLLHVGLVNIVDFAIGHTSNAVMDILENSGHVDTTSGKVLLDSLVLNGTMNSMLNKLVEIGLAMASLEHVGNVGVKVVGLDLLTTKRVTLANVSGNGDEGLSSIAHAGPLLTRSVTTNLAEMKEASVVVKSSLDDVARSGGSRELAVGAGLGKLAGHGSDLSSVDRIAVDDNRDRELGSAVTNALGLGGDARGLRDGHGATGVSRGGDANAGVDRAGGRGLGRLLVLAKGRVDGEVGLLLHGRHCCD